MSAVAWLTRDFTPDGRGGFTNLLGGCGTYRCGLPAVSCGSPAMVGLPGWSPQHGFGVVLPGGESVAWGMPGAGAFDVVVLKLLLDRNIPRMITAARALGQRVVVDVDDHYDALEADNLAFEGTDPERNRIFNRDNYRRSIMAATAVTVSTPELLDYYSGLRDHVYLVRNGVMLQAHSDRQGGPVATQQRNRPKLGWVGGIPWRSGGDLGLLSAWLPEFLQTYDLGFHHAGHTDVVPGTTQPVAPIWEVVAGLDPDRVTVSPLVDMSQYGRWSFRDYDIGLVPLVDVPFNRAKSCIKGLEYAASGIPFIASPAPEYQRLASMGVGRLAGTPEEWWAHAEALLKRGVRRTEAARQRALVKRDHTFESRAPEWADVLDAVRRLS